MRPTWPKEQVRGAGRIGRALLRHELLLLAGLCRWICRRPHGVGAAGRAFGYARGQGAMLFGFAFVCVIETVMMSFLLRGLPTVHHAFLVVDIYTAVIIIGLHAASVTRPHVLTGTTLRLRRYVALDVHVPLTAIASVHRELRTTHKKRDGELDLDIASQTNVTLELAESVEYVTFFGRPRTVRTIRLNADEPDRLVSLIREFTPTEPERTEPSPLPARPA
ncbi:hypothetical protein ACWD4G_41655 [Streptomyces sp. NPDC002643]